MPNWFRKSRHQKVLESYALLELGKWKAIHQTLNEVHANGESVGLVVHFLDTFEVLQRELALWKVPYEMPTAPLSPKDIFEKKMFEGQRVYLLLAERLRPTGNSLPEVDAKIASRFSVVACERHPLPKYDQQLEKFVGEINVPTRLGYFLSLEDPLIRLAVSETAVTVMKQFGLSDHGLITSQILTRRVDRFTRQLSASVVDEEFEDSPQDWLLKNYDSQK